MNSIRELIISFIPILKAYLIFIILKMPEQIKVNNIKSIFNIFNSTKKISSGRRKFYKYGLPFLILLVGGSFGLKQFTNVKFQYFSSQKIKPEEMEKLGIKMKKPEEVTLEAGYESIKNLDIDNWEPVRGPRPWENS